MSARAVAGLELRRAARGGELRAMIIGNAALLCAVSVGVYEMARRARRGADIAATLTASIGRLVAHLTLLLLLVVLCTAIPLMAAQAVAGERERGTLVPLLASHATPYGIVAGKLMALVVRSLCIIAAAIPFLAIAHLLGGVTPGEIVRGLAVVVATAVLVSAACVAVSSITQRSSSALVAGYALVTIVTVGTIALFGAQAAVRRTTDAGKLNHAVLFANPFVATADAISGPTGSEDRFLTPFAPFEALIGDRITILDDVGLLTDGFRFQRAQRFAERRHRKLWKDYVLASAVLSAGASVVAARRLRLPLRQDRQ